MSDHTSNLNWSVSSQPLVCPSGDDVWPDGPWFQQYPTDQHITIDEIQPGKLGRYFEALIHGWINHEPDIHCLAANLPVRDGGRTLGEFDLIVDYFGVTEHWEVAVKFYLAMGDSTNAAHWFGPNPVDTLWTKYERLVSHQLRLLRFSRARDLLASRGWQVSRTRCLMKGRLFYPFDQLGNHHLPLATQINPAHERGWWLPDQELTALEDAGSVRFVVLPKRHWLAPLDGTQSLPECNFEALGNTVHQHQAGTLHIARVDESTGIEIDRGFIVKQHWQEDVSVLLDHS